MKYALILACAGLLGFGSAACDTETASGGGTPPKIADLTVSKSEIAAGKAETLELGFSYEDAEADVSAAVVQLTFAGQDVPVSPAPINAQGQPKGIGKALVAIQAPTAGQLDIRLHLEDAQGNSSNELSATVEVK